MIDSEIIVMLSYGELRKHFIKIPEIKFHPRGNPWLLSFHFIVFGGARNIKSFCCRLKWAYGMENGRQKCTREWRSWQLGINNDASGGNSILRRSGKVAFVENTDWCGLPWKMLGNLSVAGNGTKKNPKRNFNFTFNFFRHILFWNQNQFPGDHSVVCVRLTGAQDTNFRSCVWWAAWVRVAGRCRRWNALSVLQEKNVRKAH